jgi:Na+/H+-dicarboxylate symporter
MMRKIFAPLLSPPIQVTLIIALIFLFGNMLPHTVLQGLLTASSLILTVLKLCLPWLVMSFLFLSLSRMQSGVIGFVLTLILFFIASNFIANLYGFGAAQILTTYPELCPTRAEDIKKALVPFFKSDLKPLIPTQIGLALGFLLGFMARFMPERIFTLSEISARRFIDIFINKFFVPLLPLFVGGFVAQLHYEGLLDNIFQDYAPLVGLIFGFQILYCFFILLLATKFNFGAFKKLVKDMIPPYITGMMTLSGSAALPQSLKAVKKHLKDPSMADAFLPPATNVHLLGDGTSVPFLIFATAIAFNQGLPDTGTLITSALFMAFLRFGIVSIPGGGIYVMIPVLTNSFGFTQEMTGLITAIYILFDIFNTANNVLANGASAVFFCNTWTAFKSKRG